MAFSVEKVSAVITGRGKHNHAQDPESKYGFRLKDWMEALFHDVAAGSVAGSGANGLKYESGHNGGSLRVQNYGNIDDSVWREAFMQHHRR
jgi:hypothetical protein